MTQHLTEVVGSRTLFATHYHTLCEDFETHPKVALGHMVSGVGCRFESIVPDCRSHTAALMYRPVRAALTVQDCLVEELADGTSTVTFLYKYAAGACPKVGERCRQCLYGAWHPQSVVMRPMAAATPLLLAELWSQRCPPCAAARVRHHARQGQVRGV